MRLGVGDIFAWMRVDCLRAELYRASGRIKEAREVEEGLRRLLVFADSDLTLVARLQAFQEHQVADAHPPNDRNLNVGTPTPQLSSNTNARQ